jgi:hypothetical protein
MTAYYARMTAYLEEMMSNADPRTGSPQATDNGTYRAVNADNRFDGLRTIRPSGCKAGLSAMGPI